MTCQVADVCAVPSGTSRVQREIPSLQPLVTHQDLWLRVCGEGWGPRDLQPGQSTEDALASLWPLQLLVRS